MRVERKLKEYLRCVLKSDVRLPSYFRYRGKEARKHLLNTMRNSFQFRLWRVKASINDLFNIFLEGKNASN
jgi:hypothetical protein